MFPPLGRKAESASRDSRVRSPIPEATRINGGHCKRVSETWPVTPPRGGTHTFQDFSLLMEGRGKSPGIRIIHAIKRDRVHKTIAIEISFKLVYIKNNRGYIG